MVKIIVLSNNNKINKINKVALMSENQENYNLLVKTIRVIMETMILLIRMSQLLLPLALQGQMLIRLE
jgi:hypothetical protein